VAFGRCRKCRGGSPAGERARKRRAAQAAYSVARTARRLRADLETLRLPAFRFLSFSFVCDAKQKWPVTLEAAGR
jgi:hypothetical protein